MKKILYLVTQSELGGAQKYIIDLATNLAAENKILVGAGGASEMFDELQQAKIETIKIKNLVREINPIKDFLAYFEIKKIIKNFQPDVVHLNSTKIGIIGSIAAKKLGVKKIIYTVHGFVFNEPLPNWKKNLYIYLEKLTSKFKDKLICVSEYDYQAGIKIDIPENKMTVIHNGINQLPFESKERLRAKLNLPTSKIIIGTIARDYPTKGLRYLVEAAKIIKNDFPNTIFIVINDGLGNKNLKQKIKDSDLENNFIFLQNTKNAWQFLPALDIYVCPSVKEGFPYSILEAMQAGLPIVSTDVGGVPEAIQDKKNGLLIKPSSAETIARSINWLMRNKNLAEQISHQAKNDVTPEFDLTNMIEKTKLIYSF
ncbi:MAG: glycosyltransferase family 4 protein [Candidatus Buchananbacteria bacterium]|nr:glycosyltransferase family 4 protein [Candidatus Buchananbacteria bacterium]